MITLRAESQNRRLSELAIKNLKWWVIKQKAIIAKYAIKHTPKNSNI